VTPLAAAALRVELGQALEALGRLVPWLQGVGAWAGVASALVGLLGLLAADRLRRPTAFLGGAAVGALAALALGHLLPAALSPAAWTWTLAGVGGTAGALAPRLFPALAGALAGGLLGAHLPLGSSPALGASIGGVAGAVLLAVGARRVAVVLASLAGGLLLGAGLVVLGGGRDLAAEVAARPLVLLGAAVVLGVAGAAYQLAGARGRDRERERGRGPEAPRLPRG
jgi:hypothetical protein